VFWIPQKYSRCRWPMIFVIPENSSKNWPSLIVLYPALLYQGREQYLRSKLVLRVTTHTIAAVKHWQNEHETLSPPSGIILLLPCEPGGSNIYCSVIGPHIHFYQGNRVALCTTLPGTVPYRYLLPGTPVLVSADSEMTCRPRQLRLDLHAYCKVDY
jgi:hypothetical protein